RRDTPVALDGRDALQASVEYAAEVNPRVDSSSALGSDPPTRTVEELAVDGRGHGRRGGPAARAQRRHRQEGREDVRVCVRGDFDEGPNVAVGGLCGRHLRVD